MADEGQRAKPLIVITGASGNLGQSLARAMADDFRVVGLDQIAKPDGEQVVVATDVTSRRSVEEALDLVRREHGRDIAAVIHLVAFFDFSGEPDPRYDAVNVEGTRNLLSALEGFAVERFIYASTMLVHAPAEPGERIDEDTPFDPQWEYLSLIHISEPKRR